ncbi:MULTISPECIES: aminomethyl-transferring glycine dehydrogenase subunit GcvPB [unclassified Oleiphilus]|uniref:aminomethyl-transferring glycine dehydrogenase subunit GcvPB n=4 Tax=Oleiphilus TaxID=141450 RepID=UPI0007C2FD6C|nr:MULTISPECIES: aminomethyl-transferring glycine dehydrogenase subunit GcvPB [unclassified Oleiphilus]KZY76487.1 glycine dehydrogenase (aminomethyl-transferring) [Oleiphilus sp. HI0068]KZY85959.1 glycine dehydrogenase (aminomethyl-transferring) [Oleiphilus sp. HI0069]KZY89334.1 glycine dehydrogenase (aminomethyl-transferring) [Oleiphilus sp. HI0072]KZZ12175.1 glycine dehydrogenase (aminomethyl-transferring) [Oleiphilus sp. HI0078]KZY36006.1 glycine dehydrogenase (aminomethyl-transferring) [Ol
MLIFENGSQGRTASAQLPPKADSQATTIPQELLRQKPALMPEVSELQTVRHFTNLSRKNFSIDTQFYPLGSCTMKYNPKGAQRAASLPGFISRHPLAPESHSQGYLSCVYELQEVLKEVTGMAGVSLSPMAGAQGEFAGVAMIKAYHEAREDFGRTEIIVPEAAHGTNPATAVMCGYKVKEIPVKSGGDVDLEALKEAVGPQTAGIMMTNPSTCGVFERQIEEIAKTVHDAGGLLYYDGANLNAILGKVRPGDMGFDVLHMNLHKTFATPHGGGGPGSGPVAVGERLLPYLPTPMAGCQAQADGVKNYHWVTQADNVDSIGRLSTFMGNAGIILRAYIYAVLLGREGLHRVGEFSTLSANYMAKLMADAGFELAYPERRATHEFIVTMNKQAKGLGVTAMDFAKRLLDYGYHAPTTYFPLLVPECLLIEPTETESIDELEGFVKAMAAIQKEAEDTPETVKGAPYTQPVRRLDDVKAARELDVAYSAPAE